MDFWSICILFWAHSLKNLGAHSKNNINPLTMEWNVPLSMFINMERAQYKKTIINLGAFAHGKVEHCLGSG